MINRYLLTMAVLIHLLGLRQCSIQ